jgi:hypothetical protein
MTFKFNVGEKEKCKVAFHFNQWWGNLKITVDDRPVIKDFCLASLNHVRRFDFTVGQIEKHKVVIEKWRKPLAPAFRKSKYKVFVDDKLTQEIEGF